MADITDPRFTNRSYDPSDFSWAIPFMRAGYAGRALVYAVISIYSLYAIWRGGQAQGTAEALRQLETAPWGNAVLAAIAIGLLAYAIWRCIDALWDLEDYGRGGKGAVARIGMVVTGLIHGALGIAAGALLFAAGGGRGGQGGTITQIVSDMMRDPGGRWAIGIAGALTIGAGIYYLAKAIRQSYRNHLRANRFTLNWSRVLQAGIAAQGVVVSFVGGFLVWAAWTANPYEAGGLGKTFDWLAAQTYGQILTTALALGLLAFALFCLVNAMHRIVPKAAGDDTVTLARKMKAAAGRG